MVFLLLGFTQPFVKGFYKERPQGAPFGRSFNKVFVKLSLTIYYHKEQWFFIIGFCKFTCKRVFTRSSVNKIICQAVFDKLPSQRNNRFYTIKYVKSHLFTYPKDYNFVFLVYTLSIIVLFPILPVFVVLFYYIHLIVFYY